MKRYVTCTYKRILASGLALLTVATAILPAGAAGLTPTSDETYYATLDYYGGLMDSSVVKSIRTYGSASISDYGVYDEVINLTDSRAGTLTADGVAFDLTGNVPEKFYFEGKTTKPYAQFPWFVSLSYTLNGLPAQAEDLAGEKGVVEITLDALPKLTASEYSKNNLVLTAVSMFNGDDILSLEAPGAQVQLIGNLYCVLYAVLPGEEQHVTIRVGTDSFTYSGMIFLAVPATLEQLDQVADLRKAKEDTEDAYHAMLDSMHAILDSMEGMSGNLNTAASGLEQLNKARSIISDGKGQVYTSVDEALAAGNALAESLKPIADLKPEETETTGDGEGLEDFAGETAAPETSEIETLETLETEIPEASETEASETETEEPTGDETDGEEVVVEPPLVMTGHLTTAQKALTETNALLNEMSSNILSLRPEVAETRRILENIQKDLSELKSSSKDLNSISRQLSRDLNDLESSADRLGNALGSTRTISSVTSPTGDIKNQVSGAVNQWQNYQQTTGQNISLKDFLVGAGTSSDKADFIVNAANGKYDDALGAADSAIGSVNDKISEVNSLVNSIARPAGTVMHDVADLTTSLKRLTDLLEDLSDGNTVTPIENAQDAAAMALRISGNVDAALDQLEEMTGIMNTYDPDLQQAISDTQTIVVNATNSLNTLLAASGAAKDLLQQSGPSLDRGTQQALSGVAAALRKSTAGLDQTHTVRAAVDTIDALLTDQWDSHTGEDNNVLLMDASAPPQSLTDSRNQNVGSIQYIMRTQEIKVEAAEDNAPPAAEEADHGTVWTRILDMFRDIWAAITGIFS